MKKHRIIIGPTVKNLNVDFFLVGKTLSQLIRNYQIENKLSKQKKGNSLLYYCFSKIIYSIRFTLIKEKGMHLIQPHKNYDGRHHPNIIESLRF